MAKFCRGKDCDASTMQADGFIDGLCDTCWKKNGGDAERIKVFLESAPEKVQKAIAEREKAEIFKLTLNVVTCGDCGKPFGHRMPYKGHKLYCPYCGFHDDISSFPDMWYENGQDSLFKLER